MEHLYESIFDNDILNKDEIGGRPIDDIIKERKILELIKKFNKLNDQRRGDKSRTDCLGRPLKKGDIVLTCELEMPVPGIIYEFDPENPLKCAVSKQAPLGSDCKNYKNETIYSEFCCDILLIEDISILKKIIRA